MEERTMALGSVGAVSNVASPGTGKSAGSAASPLGLSQSQFFQLLTAQLQNQDPLNPVSSTDFTSQLSQMSMLTGIQQLNTSFQQMLQIQQLSQGAALVGKTIRYGTGTDAGSGVVQAISVNNGTLQVQVNGKNITADQISSIVQGTPGS